MPSEIFSLSYDGDEIRNGEMDVAALGPALIAMGELFAASNEALNGTVASVETKVKADFKEGSFEVFYSISQMLHDHSAGVIGSLYVLGSDNLVSQVIGKVVETAKDKLVDKATEGVFTLLEKLHGKQPEASSFDERRNVFIFNTGNNNHFEVDQPTGALYRNARVRKAAAKVAAPLTRPGINSLVVRRDRKTVATLAQADVPEIEGPEVLGELSLSSGAGSDPAPQQLIVQILKPSFPGGKWSVSDGSRKFEVLVADTKFVERIHAREVGFYDGDLYSVEMITRQTLVGGRLRTTRTVTRVIEPIPLQSQEHLPGVSVEKLTPRSRKKSR